MPKLKAKTNQLLKFLELCNKFALIERNKTKNDHTRETDAEHSYQLATSSWYLNKALNLKLDDEKILKYSLIHDLPEVFAGDICSLAKHRDKKLKETQKRREGLAINKIAKDFPEFAEYKKYAREYEDFTNKEARFVYAMDKLITFANIYLMEPDTYCIERKCTKKEYVEERLPKLAINQNVKEIFLELVEYFDKLGIFYKS